MAKIDLARDLIKRTLSFSKAPNTEVHVGGGRYSLTRFANNLIHQNVEERNIEVSVRVQLKDGRSARASSNRTDNDGLKKLVQRATEAAKLAPANKRALDVFEAPKGEPESDSHVHAKTEGYDAQKRAEAVIDVIAECKKSGLTAAGLLSTTRGSVGNYGDMGTMAMGNSKGLFRFYDKSSSEFSLTVMGEDSSGWVSTFAGDVNQLNVQGLTRIAIDKALASAKPKGIEPGPYTVILEANAAAELVRFLGWGLGGRGYHESSNWAAGALGKPVMGKNFQLRSDPYHKDNPRRFFDGEGVRSQALDLVKDGVLKAVVYDRLAAKEFKAKATGHGPRLPSPWGASPGSLVVGGGQSSVEQMIKSTKRGILVTRLWYNRLVEPKRVLVTGMTRDGTFLIKDGKIAHGIKNMRYTQSVLEAFKNIVALSPAIRASGMLVPAMKIDNFRFSSATRF